MKQLIDHTVGSHGWEQYSKRAVIKVVNVNIGKWINKLIRCVIPFLNLNHCHDLYFVNAHHGDSI